MGPCLGDHLLMRDTTRFENYGTDCGWLEVSNQNCHGYKLYDWRTSSALQPPYHSWNHRCEVYCSLEQVQTRFCKTASSTVCVLIVHRTYPLDPPPSDLLVQHLQHHHHQSSYCYLCHSATQLLCRSSSTYAATWCTKLVWYDKHGQSQTMTMFEADSVQIEESKTDVPGF